MTYAVQHSPDLDRILRLPVRDWRVGLGGRYGTAEQLVEILSARYRRPGSSALLRSCQAVGLAECHDFGGLFAPLQVGAGKTLLSFLAPLACEAERPVLLVPARHREKTLAAWDDYGRDWRLPGIDVRGLRDGTRAPTFSGRTIKIISGGQTGADRGGLDAALALGLDHGGHCTGDKKAEDGRIPERYNLTRIRSPHYADRTERNVVESEATILIAPFKAGPGSRLTKKLCKHHDRPYLPIHVEDLETDRASIVETIRWFTDGLSVVNVAGSRESKSPGLQARVEGLLREALGAPTIVVESYERISCNSHDRRYLTLSRGIEKMRTEKGRRNRAKAAADAFNEAYPIGQTVFANGQKCTIIGPARPPNAIPVVETCAGWFQLSAIEIETNPLEALRPDLIVADEAHSLANPSAGVTKKVRRALELAAEAGDSVRFVGMSGTITKRSIKNYAHLARWALGDLSPLPLTYAPLQEWASYLDTGGEALFRPSPGALVQLVPLERHPFILEDPVTEVRRGFALRVESTPGVVSVRGRGCEASLEIGLVRHEIRDSALLLALAKYRAEWVLPDGRPICDALEYARHMRELSCGFFYRWVRDPPEAWSAARKAWRTFIARAIKAYPRLDTELQVANWCARGQIDSEGAYQAWRAIRESFRPVTEAVWISDEVIEGLIARARGPARTLVWTGHVAALERIGALSGWRMFGAGSGADLERVARESPDPIVLSINACSDGFNLQARNFSICLGWPRSGKTAEQFVGRTHRDPTDHDEVRAEAYCATPEAAEDLEKSWEDARYIQDTTGVQQKLVFADKIGWDPLAGEQKQA